MGGFSKCLWVRPGRKQGFTLVELLVVIGIISVLAAIILPVYGRAREAARQTNCTSNLHQIAMALRMYYDDYRGYPPPLRTDLNRGGLGVLFAARYLGGDTRVLRCPDDPQRDDPNPTYSSYNAWYNYFGYEADGTPIPIVAYRAPEVDPAERPLTPLRAEEVYAPVQGGVRVSLLDQFGQDVWQPTPDPADTDPGTWTSAFPGLCNRNAADDAIVTHCFYHRSFYGGVETQQDLVVRLGGDVTKALVRNTNWTMSVIP